MTDLSISRGVPDHLCSDNGSEFTATAVRAWLAKVGVRTLYIEPGSTWKKDYVESFNGKLREEPLNGEVFDALLEVQVLIERWRVQYNTQPPHWSLGDQTWFLYAGRSCTHEPSLNRTLRRLG